MSGPRRPCAACGIGSTSGRLCSDCASAKRDTESPWDLGEGYWRQRKGVLVEWVPLYTPEPAPEPELETGHARCLACRADFVPIKVTHIYCSQRCAKRAGWARRSEKVNKERNKWRAVARERRLTPQTSVPCETCGADVGQVCKSPSGTSQAPHAARLMAAGLRPRCECGAQLPPSKKKWCEDCQAKVRRDGRRSASDRYRAKTKGQGTSERGTCSHCGRVLQVRVNGAMRLHRDTAKRPCPGSRRPAATPEQEAA